MAEAFDPYHVWLGITPNEQPANHYRLLGIAPFESDPSVIENAVDRQMVHLRTFQLSRYAKLSEKLLNEVAAAKICLLRPEKKAIYDEQLRRQLQVRAGCGENLMTISLEHFSQRVVQSGLLSGSELSAFLESLPQARKPNDGETLARELFHANRLTRYQAQMLYQGRTKGWVFGEYRVLDKLGQGGMGVVLKAEHRRMKRLVAVKMIGGKTLRSPDAVQRFYREVEAAAKLSHPNIVQAYDASEHEGLHYLVMEYVEGKDLATIVKEHGPLPVAQAVECTVQAARGLEYAHGRGIVHRDVKPGNLLLDKEGTVKILDMGLARFTGLADDDAPDRLTASGQVIGTCDYMAPEQVRDTRNADHRSDIYSLGCTLYRLLTGQVMYPGESLMQILMAHLEAPIPSLRAARPDVPLPLDAVFQKMVAKRAADRQRSMAEVVADLERCLANRSGAAQTLAEQSGISDPRLQEALCFLQETAPAAPTGTAIHTEQASPAGRQTLGSPALSSQTTGAGREAASGELPAAVGRKKAILLAAGGGAGLLVIACVVILAVIPHNAGPDARTPKGVVTQGGPQVRTGGAGTPSVAPRPAADAASSPVPAAGKARVVTASADHTAPTPVSAVTGSPVQAPPPVAKPPIAVAHAAVAMIPPSVPSKATSVAAVVELQSRTKPVPASAATGPSKQTSPTPINSQSPTPGSSSLLPVPAESVREAANKLAQDVYRSEYDGAKTSTARRSLAKRILDDARKSQGSATERYVLLRLARDVALAGQDENVALEAIDELSRTFAINAWGMRVEAMQQLVKGPHPTAARREFSQRALALAEEALKADRIAAAGDLAQLASSEAGKARDREVALCARNVAKEVEEAMKTYTVVEAAQGLLKADPDDPAANLAVGKYLCFVKDDWDQGLSRLAKGADNKLKALAESELSALADLRSSAARRSQSASSTPNPEYPANVPLTLADGWWDLGQSAAGKSRQGMLLRAAYWYQQVGDVASALARNKVERRLAEIAKLGGGMAEASRPRILVNSLGMKVALIRAGEFEMGSSAEDIAWATRQVGTTRRDYDLWSLLFQSEGPRHRVRISKPFYLGVYEVTQAEYQHVMGVNPSEYSSGGAHKARVFGQDTARHPVERVSWNQAMEFCRRLSTMPQESSAHREYTLPTEAQWEYACRAGTTSRWHCGDDQTTLSEYAWIKDNAGLATHPVGQKEPNAWGLHDMLGNGREWCLDWYAVDFYQSSQPVDPTGPTTGEMRVHRGGCFLSGAAYCRSAARGKCLPQKTEEGLGFRVACWVGQKTR